MYESVKLDILIPLSNLLLTDNKLIQLKLYLLLNTGVFPTQH